QNAGSHRVEFDAANLASGIYFYKLSADNVSATQKMMLMK
ncbi:MAG: T9SS type A sorting domain-containing protein, partial [Calditrichaeota bacterium]|nr:T9SS type A sorting domain-containing protein [Calditrichota bacterium]